jgi:pheromone shutdown protein TraB
MAEIILAGTVHVDHKGPERLETALTHYKPSLVCLESTPEGATKGWTGHLDLQKKWEETPWHRIYTPEQIARVKLELMSSYYESWVLKVYKNGSPDIRLFCIDRELTDQMNGVLDYKQKMWILQQLASGKTIQDLLTPVDISIKDFVEKGNAEEHQEYVDNEYDKTDANEFISRYGEGLFKVAILERDKNFAKKIRKIYVDNPDKVIVAILGNMHIFGNYEGSTYDLLSDLNPKRLKLKDADGM